MRTLSILFFLMLFQFGLVTFTKASTGDILNQDFSGFSGITYAQSEINGWTVVGCSYLENDIRPKSLLFDSYNSSLTTPAFQVGSKCNAVLTFRCANTSQENISKITLTIDGDGTFNNGKKIFNRTIKGNGTDFIDQSFKLYDINTDTKLTFSRNTSGNYFVLDDIVISTADAIILKESETNSLETKIADVSLERTLTGGIWNTLCLPFNVGIKSLEQFLGDDQDIKLRTFKNYENNTITFEEEDSVEAGTPFLIKLNTTVANPKFQLRNMTTTDARTVTDNGVSMVGVYNPTELPTDGLFLTASGQLKKPSGSRQMKGLRAYFIVPNSTASTRVIFDGITAVEEIPVTAEDDIWYTLNGQRLEGRPSVRGIYINNGKKYIIK